MELPEFEDFVFIFNSINKPEITEEELKKADEKLHKLLIILIQKSSVISLSKGEDIPYTKEDFDCVTTKVLPILQCILRVYDALVNYHQYLHRFQETTLQLLIIDVFLIALQYSDSTYFWSDDNCSSISSKILHNILVITGNDSFIDLFHKEDISSKVISNALPRGFLFKLLSKFSEKFTKKAWKGLPSYTECYKWIIFKIKFPYLSEYIVFLLPPALFIIDDWEQKHKILGAQSLMHIMCNTAASELRWYGRANVIFDALKTSIYSREYETLSHVYPAAIKSAWIVDGSQKNDGLIKNSNLDFIANHLLREMAFEEMLAKRTVYTEALKMLVESMELSAIKWSDRLLNVCQNYLETFEGKMAQDRLNILRTLEVFIKSCWPRMQAHSERILKMIVKLLYSLEKNENEVLNKDELTLECKQVVILIHAACPVRVKQLCLGLNEAVSILPSITNIFSCVLEND